MIYLPDYYSLTVCEYQISDSVWSLQALCFSKRASAASLPYSVAISNVYGSESE